MNIDEGIIRHIVIHRISTEGSTSTFSDHELIFDSDDNTNVLNKLLLRPFVAPSLTFEFSHEIDLTYNVTFNLCRNILEGQDFVDNSKALGEYLLSVSKHPNIKDGDFIVAKFDDLRIGSEYFEAVGLYKFEQKEGFLEIVVDDEIIKTRFQQGLGSKKPDKACLILFTDEPYTILVIDNNQNQTEYWQQNFINLSPKDDSVNATNNFLNLARTYFANKVNDDFELSRADQIDLLNRSVGYFKERDVFDRESFETDVIGDSKMISSLRRYESDFQQARSLKISDQFEISADAVKKQSRVFKSILKLDKNFHVYIHGDRDLIEQGIEPDGRKYYKLYFNRES